MGAGETLQYCRRNSIYGTVPFPLFGTWRKINDLWAWTMHIQYFNMYITLFILKVTKVKKLSHLCKQVIKLRLSEWHEEALNNSTKLSFSDGATALLITGMESCPQVIFSVLYLAQEHVLNVQQRQTLISHWLQGGGWKGGIIRS